MLELLLLVKVSGLWEKVSGLDIQTYRLQKRACKLNSKTLFKTSSKVVCDLENPSMILDPTIQIT